MYHTSIGHAHLKVRDLDRSIAFYTRFFDLKLVEKVEGNYAFLTGGAMHHEIALQNVGSNAPQPPPYGTGLYHVAFVYPDRRELGRAVSRLLDRGVYIDHATDHGGTVSVYLSDPDDNGVELYYDRPRSALFNDDGRLVLKADRFDHRELLVGV